MSTHDVLVVGAGPTGLTAALLLEQQGVDTCVVERRPHPQRAPAAHVVNARTFEICRAAGVDMSAVAQAAMDPKDAGFVYWVPTLGGEPIGRLPFEQQGDDQLRFTPHPLRNLSQNKFEPLLLDTLEAKSHKAPLWSTEWVSSDQGPEGVVTRVRDLETGEERELTSRYVIAADGAGSRIRKSLGIDVVGPAAIQSFVMVHFEADFRGVPNVPPGVLFFLCNPEVGGTFVVHDLDRECVFMLPFDANSESVDDYDAARCEAQLRKALADPTLELEIASIGSWTMTAQVAERYRDGRIFIAGDAAHRFPPTGGLGLNSGVQDAHNLAWKLAAVLNQRADPDLLSTYESERRPVAQQNADQSLRNAVQLIEVPQALGILDPNTASLEQMRTVLDDAEGRASIDAAIEHQAEHFDMPGLQLGFCYAEGALVRGPDDAVPELEVRRYEPTGTPGARVPHLWLDGARRTESLLDRIPLDRFALILGPDAAAWTEGLPAEIEAVRLDDSLGSALRTWLAEAGIERDGALLVRPDQHVAWRSSSAPPDTAEVLDGVLSQVLGRR